MFHVTSVRKMNGACDILLQKEKNVRKMTWIRTQKRNKTPAELKLCLGNNIYLLLFRKYDAEKHSFHRSSKRISRIKDELENPGRRNIWMSPWGKQPLRGFSLKVWKSKNAQSVVRHLPLDISKITKFILQRGAWVQATVTGKHYRRSPLIQGGLEAPCLVTVTMPGSIMNHLLIVRYEKLLGNSISNRKMKK